MNELNLLDVTLRDGGYKNHFHFPKGMIRNIIQRLDSSGIQYIEVGYRNGPLKPMHHIGSTGLSNKEHLLFCRQYIRSAKLTVIFHPKNITEADLAEMKECGVDTVRVCVPLKNPDLSLQFIRLAKQYGFEVFSNITRASFYSKEQLLTMTKQLESEGVDAVYLADSNGSLSHNDVENIFSYLYHHCQVALGFHAHDNLFLAQANALAAIKSGVRFIDVSLSGLGKGAGNLRTEGLVSYLHSQKNNHYDLCTLLEAAQDISFNFYNNELPVKDILLGIFNLSMDDAEQVGPYSNIKDYYQKIRSYQERQQQDKSTTLTSSCSNGRGRGLHKDKNLAANIGCAAT